MRIIEDLINRINSNYEPFLIMWLKLDEVAYRKWTKLEANIENSVLEIGAGISGEEDVLRAIGQFEMYYLEKLKEYRKHLAVVV